MNNIQLSCQASEAYIHKAVQRDFTAYSKLLVQLNNNSKQTPDYIFLTMHGTDSATPVQCHLVVYGVKDWSDSVYPGVYDGLGNEMFKYKNGDMQMQVDLDMNDKRIINLADPIDDNDAMKFGYFINLFKTKYSGTISSGVFQSTNPTNNFQLAADGNKFFNLYSVVFTSNIQVLNAQMLINGKIQRQSTNTNTYHRIGNIIVGNNAFDLPKSMEFLSIDSLSILNDIELGTAVTGTFEVLHSDHFDRYHKQMELSNDKIMYSGTGMTSSPFTLQQGGQEFKSPERIKIESLYVYPRVSALQNLILRFHIKKGNVTEFKITKQIVSGPAKFNINHTFDNIEKIQAASIFPLRWIMICPIL